MRSINKRGQMKLSFGMIFSIFLIIVFIAFAFYAIKKFVGLQQDIQIKSFVNDLQNDVDSMWTSVGDSSSEESYSLPNKIESICFRNNELSNLMFISSKPIPSENIKHLDIDIITSEKNPYCITNEDGKVKLIISKDYGEDLVIITKQS